MKKNRLPNRSYITVKSNCKKNIVKCRSLRHILFTFAFILFMLFLPVSSYAATDYDCSAGRHNFVEISRTEPTATTDGKVVYRCALCGVNMTDILLATDHIWGPWIVDTAATCTETGEEHRHCSRGVGHDETQTIPALGHDYKAKVTKEPTYTDAGVTTYTCSRCGVSYTKTIPALVHDYKESITKEPSCTEDGVNTFTCSICGDVYTEAIPKLGHDYKETTAKEPTCMADGMKIFTCARCGDTYTEPIPALGHDWGPWYVKAAAQPGVDGVEERDCSHGDNETRAIPALALSAKKPFFTPLSLALGGVDAGLLVASGLIIYPYYKWARFFRKRAKNAQRLRQLKEMVANKYGFK